MVSRVTVDPTLLVEEIRSAPLPRALGALSALYLRGRVIDESILDLVRDRLSAAGTQRIEITLLLVEGGIQRITEISLETLLNFLRRNITAFDLVPVDAGDRANPVRRNITASNVRSFRLTTVGREALISRAIERRSVELPEIVARVYNEGTEISRPTALRLRRYMEDVQAVWLLTVQAPVLTPNRFAIERRTQFSLLLRLLLRERVNFDGRFAFIAQRISLNHSRDAGEEIRASNLTEVLSQLVAAWNAGTHFGSILIREIRERFETIRNKFLVAFLLTIYFKNGRRFRISAPFDLVDTVIEILERRFVTLPNPAREIVRTDEIASIDLILQPPQADIMAVAEDQNRVELDPSNVFPVRAPPSPTITEFDFPIIDETISPLGSPIPSPPAALTPLTSPPRRRRRLTSAEEAAGPSGLSAADLRNARVIPQGSRRGALNREQIDALRAELEISEDESIDPQDMDAFNDMLGPDIDFSPRPAPARLSPFDPFDELLVNPRSPRIRTVEQLRRDLELSDDSEEEQRRDSADEEERESEEEEERESEEEDSESVSEPEDTDEDSSDPGFRDVNDPDRNRPYNFNDVHALYDELTIPWPERNRRRLRQLILEAGRANDRLLGRLHLDDGRILTIALKGPLESREEMVEAISNKFRLDAIPFIDISDGTVLVIPSRIVRFRFLLLNRAGPNLTFGYFPFDNKTAIDLTRYQVYSVDDERPKDQENMTGRWESCLTHTLRLQGIPEWRLDQIKACLPNSGYHMKRSDLVKVCHLVKRNIDVSQHIGTQVTRLRYPKKDRYPDTLNTAMYQEHMFTLEATIYTGFSIKNYARVRDLDRWWMVTSFDCRGSPIRRTDSRVKLLDSLQLIQRMDKHGWLVESEHLCEHPKRALHCVIGDRVTDSEQKCYETPEPRDNRPLYCFADLECSVRQAKHAPIVAGYSKLDDPDDSVVQYFGRRCIIHFLRDLSRYGRTNRRDVTVYFHNLKYDLYAMVDKLVGLRSILKRQGQVYSAEVHLDDCKITMLDSYKLIDKPLREFSKLFDLNMDKGEVVPYTYYHENNCYIGCLADRREGSDFLNRCRPPYTREDLVPQLQVILDDEMRDGCPNYYVSAREFDAGAYYAHYHKLDCLVLKKGLVAFRRQIDAFSRECGGKIHDIFAYITLSSFGDDFFSSRQCYAGVNEVKGNLRNFLQLSVRGGRVIVNPLHLGVTCSGRIVDFDGVSLYPSAIHRLGMECGYPVGPALVLHDGVDMWQQAYFFVRVNITAIAKHQQLAMISKRGPDGCMVYYNRGDTVSDVVMGKIALEDAVKYCGISYEVVEGVYWNGDSTRNCAAAMSQLFELRKRYKAEGNELQSVVKLVMNASYGKLIIKRSDKNTIIKDVDKAEEYVRKFYPVFMHMVQFGDHCEITLAQFDQSFNRCHVGSMILEMSKRIMNEVLDLANSNGMTVYYMDTDSMHFDRADLPRLAELFQSVHGRELVGKNLGQFHSDFALPCGHSDAVVSRAFFAFAPKTYCDRLVCEECGDEGHHFRMKGVPARCVEYEARVRGMTVLQVYQYLAGHEIMFNLNPPGIPSFELEMCGVYTRPAGTFLRRIGPL